MGLANKTAGILAPLVFAAVILKSSDSVLFEELKNNALSGAAKTEVLNELISRVVKPYAALSLFLFLFGVLVYFSGLPELKIKKNENSECRDSDRSSPFAYPYLIFGAIAIFFHVASQIIAIDTIISYAHTMGFDINSAKIFPSIAHTDAIYEEAAEAYKNGFTLITHFYSCMNTMTRRNAFKFAGTIEAGYLLENMDIEIIADGIHVPEPFLKLVLKNKSPDHIALVTDSMRAAGTDDKQSILGSLINGQPVLVEDGVAKLADRSAFAGSVATADRLVRTMVKIAGCDLPNAVKMASTTPARIMGVGDRKGKIAKGFDADIVIFDKDINIEKTIIERRIFRL